MIEQQVPSRRFDWPSFSLWVGLTMLAFIIAWDLHFQTSGPRIYFNPQDIDPSGAVFGFALGAVSGLIIGALQWIVLKSWMPTSRIWIIFNMIGFGLVHALHDSLPYRPLDMPLLLVIDGIIVGLAQTNALRHALSRPLLWVPITSFAWFLGFQLGFAWSTVNGIAGNPFAEFVTVGGTAGLIIGTITGVALRLLMKKSM